MADNDLIKYARARDDQNFIWRTAAAMLLEARYKFNANPDMTAEARKLMDWVLDNPLVAPALMVAFVATEQPVADGITYEDGVIDTSGATDAAIKNAVGFNWNTVANKMFLTAPTP